MTDATTWTSMVQKKVLIDIKECSFKARMSSYAVKVTRAKIATLNYTKGHTHSHDVEYWVSAFLDCVSFVTNCCGWFQGSSHEHHNCGLLQYYYISALMRWSIHKSVFEAHCNGRFIVRRVLQCNNRGCITLSHQLGARQVGAWARSWRSRLQIQRRAVPSLAPSPIRS